ncbi:MAG: hypothetical protein JNK19_06140 [Tabrizicola sp.]|nr:hypothetical protein [Tabrizicola sp.]
MYIYVIFGFAAVLGAVAVFSVFILLASRTALSVPARMALAIALGIMVVGFYSIGVGYALFHRVYVPPTGMDQTGAGVIFLVSLVMGSASALFFGFGTGLWERLRKK